MLEHDSHIIPEPGCPACKAAVLTADDVKRFAVARLVAEGADPAEAEKVLHAEIDPDDPSVVNVTLAPRPMGVISVVIRRHDS